MLTILAGCFIVGVLVYAGVSSRQKPPGDPIIPPGPVSPPLPERLGSDPRSPIDVPPITPRLVTPPPFQADRTILTTFSNRPEMQATLVTVDIDTMSIPEAVAQLAAAAGLSGTLPANPPSFIIQQNPISIHLKDQPLKEAILQLQTQAQVALTVTSDGIKATYPSRKMLPGRWSHSGPFTFLLQTIRRQIILNRDGQPIPQDARLHGSGDFATIEIKMEVEPRIRILTYPRALELVEATDNHGNSLIPPQPPNLGTPSNDHFPMRVILDYPKNNPGRRITTLRGIAHYAVDFGSEPLVVKDPTNATPVTTPFGGLSVTLEKPRWTQSSQSMEMVVTFRRGDYKGDWKNLAKGISGIKPKLESSDVPRASAFCTW